MFLPAVVATNALGASASPNVVLIISDDQAFSDYGFMGHPQIDTPHLDQLAKESLTFTRGYVPDSLCRPSLATMITGLYPRQHGITGNDPGLPGGARGGGGRANPKFAPIYEKLMQGVGEHATLPRELAKKGYLSLQTGKWWEGSPRRGGFTHGMTHGDPKRGGRHGDVGLKIGREGLQPIAKFMDEAIEEKKPFFVWYAPFMPHTPHTPPERLLAKYKEKAPTIAIARYWAMCEWFDETCGELLKLLEERDIAENTVVLYVCDNGWIQDPGRPQRYAPRSKRTPYEGGIRTPIMVRYPGKVTPRRDEKTLVSSIDLAPTILNACGLAPTSDMRGLDLTDADALAEREAVFGATYSHDVPDVDAPTTGLQYRWVISGDWKLIVPYSPNVAGGSELYHVSEDPFEKSNLIDKEPERADALRKRLDAWWPGPESG